MQNAQILHQEDDEPLLITGLTRVDTEMLTRPGVTLADVERLHKLEMMTLLISNKQHVNSNKSKQALAQQLHTLLARRGARSVEQLQAGPGAQALPQCRVCMDGVTAFIFGQCGHLGVCAACRDTMFALRPQYAAMAGVVRNMDPRQADGYHITAGCPYCRMQHSRSQVKPVFLP